MYKVEFLYITLNQSEYLSGYQIYDFELTQPINSWKLSFFMKFLNCQILISPSNLKEQLISDFVSSGVLFTRAPGSTCSFVRTSYVRMCVCDHFSALPRVLHGIVIFLVVLDSMNTIRDHSIIT